MEVKLAAGWKGKKVESPKRMTELLRTSITDIWCCGFKQDEAKIQIDDELSRLSVCFSLYKDIKLEFTNSVCNGPYYQQFIKHFPITVEIPKEQYRAKGAYIWYNEKYQKQKVKCWAYDINASYPTVFMKYNAPNVNNPLGYGVVEENQVGFVTDYEGFRIMVDKGEIAEERYELLSDKDMEPIRKYVKDSFNAKNYYKKVGDKINADKEKSRLNNAIGVLRNHNIDLYTWILTKARREIEQWVDEDTIAINTDCIYSAKPRPEIPLGNNIGEYKEDENNGTEIYFHGSNYDWGNKKCMRGVVKELQNTYDLVEGVQTRSPDYKIQGYLEIVKNED